MQCNKAVLPSFSLLVFLYIYYNCNSFIHSLYTSPQTEIKTNFSDVLIVCEYFVTLLDWHNEGIMSNNETKVNETIPWFIYLTKLV